MSSVIPFTFNKIASFTVTVDGKPWTRAREVSSALEYGEKSKTTTIVKHRCSKENFAQKYQMSSVHAVCTLVDWPKDSQKYDIYINKEGIYELLISSQQSKAKNFRKHCCNVMFPHIRQQLTDKMVDDLRHEHQHIIEEKDAVLAFINDDLQDRENQIQAIQYENVAFQAQRDLYQAQLQRCEDTITHLRARYVDHASYPGKDNIIIIVRKHTTFANDKYHDLPCYISRIQRRKRYVKVRWLNRHFPDHEVIVELDNANSIHAFDRVEEEGHVERR